MAMKRLLILCITLACSGFAAGQGNPWVGTWKLDPSKSQMVGETFSFSKSKAGMLRYSDGSAYSYTFAVDGKEHKTFENRTTTWTADGENKWTSVTKQDGKTLFTVQRELSADGNTLTFRAKGTSADGLPMDNVTVSKRTSAGTGLLGTWRTTRYEPNPPDIVVISQPAPGMIRLEQPRYKFVWEGKTDGTAAAPQSGPMTPVGYTSSVKQASSGKLSLTNKLNGKPDSYSTLTLAGDGKSYTDVSWSHGRPSEKTKSVFVRQ
jgi:hypothetical protein